MDRSIGAQFAPFFAAGRPAVVAVHLFVGVARGKNDERSDVDVAVLFDLALQVTLTGGRLALEGELSAAHLVVLSGAPADLVQRVLRDGGIIADRDRATRLRFEVQRRNE